MIKTYSLKKDGYTLLSTNFKVSEFKCKDGSDEIKICETLVKMLQAVRDHFGRAVDVSSAYRNAAYNAKCGGAKDSQHLYGTAADFRISGVDPREIARWIEANLWGKGVNGLGLYDYAKTDKAGFVHIDTRSGKTAQWIQTKSSGKTGYKVVGSITRDHLGGTPTLKRGSKGTAVVELQTLLHSTGCGPGAIDGDFGEKTEAAVKNFQTLKRLSITGIVDEKTWAALKN